MLDFFFAERHTVESNFHIDTTLKFDNIDLSWLWPWVPLALLILAAIVGLMFLMFYVKRTLEKQEALYDDEPAPEKRQWNDVVRTDRYACASADVCMWVNRNVCCACICMPFVTHVRREMETSKEN